MKNKQKKQKKNNNNKIILYYNMIYLHIIVLLFFTLLLIYSLFYPFFNTIEGLECSGGQAIANDPLIVSKANSNDVEELKKKMEELKNIKSRVDKIDAQTNQNTDGIKQLSKEASNVGSDTLGGFDASKGKDSKIPKATGLD
jgi:hypothetical protein